MYKLLLYASRVSGQGVWGKTGGCTGHCRIVGKDEDSRTEPYIRMWWHKSRMTRYRAMTLQPTNMWSLRFIHLFRGCSQREATAWFTRAIVCSIHASDKTNDKRVIIFLLKKNSNQSEKRLLKGCSSDLALHFNNFWGLAIVILKLYSSIS